jgi:hypothetical protein
MRIASLWSMACLMAPAMLGLSQIALGQGEPGVSSLLPLPALSAPPGYSLSPARQASAPVFTPRFRQTGGYFAEASDASNGPVLAGKSWDEPGEIVPTPRGGLMQGGIMQGGAMQNGQPGSQFAGQEFIVPGGGMPGCNTCGPAGMGPRFAGCPGGIVPSPFFQSLNTAGLPPLALPGGMQFRPGFWFGSLAGLVMTRDAPNAWSTTYNSLNPNTNLLDTGQARSNWAGGGQVMFGRWFGPQRYGFQFLFWGLGPMTGSASVTDPNYQLSTPLNLGGVSIGPNDPTFYYDNAHEHALWRNSSFYNVEWNALRRWVIAPGGCCPPRLIITGIAGVRYFRFHDNLIFGGVNADSFDTAGGSFAAYLNTGVTNSLGGFQFGSRFDYFVRPRVRLYVQPMVAFLGNHVTQREHLYSGDGLQGFDVFASRTTFSTLGQIDVGAGYQFTPRFSAYAAYRLMGFTRMALADNQVPHYLADQDSMRQIKTNGDLILHGVMIGGMYNF